MLFVFLITIVVCSTGALCLRVLSESGFLTVLGHVFAFLAGGAITYAYVRLKR